MLQQKSHRAHILDTRLATSEEGANHRNGDNADQWTTTHTHTERRRNTPSAHTPKPKKTKKQRILTQTPIAQQQQLFANR